MAFASVLSLLVGPLSTHAAEPPAPPTAKIDLLPGPAIGRVDRVTVDLQVGGKLLAPENASDRASKTKGEPMSVRGKLSYDERRLSESRSVRHYNLAEATIKTGERTKSPQLPTDRRLILANRGAEQIELVAPAGPLTRDQLDLIDVIGATLGIDAVLPTKLVNEGESWSIDGPAMGRLLGLNSVEMCEVSALIDDVNRDYARFQLSGAVHGVIDGAATEIDVRAVGLFSLKTQRLTQLNLAIREDRKVGPATPGFKGIAKARVKIEPIGATPELSGEKVAGLAKLKIDAATPLVTDATQQDFQLQHDRQWFAAGDDRRTMQLRRVSGEQLAAEATFTVTDASRPLSLADFESQVRATLGDGLQTLVSSEQWTNPAGCRCVAVVAQGDEQGRPLEWRYYQAAPSNGAGRRVTIATTIEPTADNGVATAARRLINSMRIGSQKVASKSQNGAK